jgi:hypothetical protein
MKIFETITEQARAMHLPLFAVTMAAAARVDTPVLLMMHWHGFQRATPLTLPGIQFLPRALPGSALQLNQRWDCFEMLDSAMLEAAWQLGAWDVERLVQRPCSRLGADASEALACRRAFAVYPDVESSEEAVVMEAPDRDELLDLAARKGYIRWMFRPRKGGIWETLNDEDSTVAPEGGRALPCPVGPQPYDAKRPGRMVYRLGRVERIIVPDTH